MRRSSASRSFTKRAFCKTLPLPPTRVYQCIAQTPCGKSPDHCNDLPKTGVGQRYCDGFRQLCGVALDACTSPDKLETNLFNWQRDQVNTEILRYLEPGCDAAQKCVNAYFAALD